MKAYIPIEYFKHTGYIPKEPPSSFQDPMGTFKKERFNEQVDYPGTSKGMRKDDMVSTHSKTAS